MKKMLGVLMLVGACAVPLGQPVPQSATLSRDMLTLRLSDGTVCRADWSVAPVGRMDACGPGYGYAVSEVSNPNILRQIWTELTRALGAEGSVPPMAEVVITDPSGIDYSFASPPPAE